MPDPKLVALSDLHLWGAEDPLYRALLRFIDQKLSDGDKFFIIGDLFDLFVGGKPVFIERYAELIKRIRNLGSRQVEVFYFEGNHDFHLKGIFGDCRHVRIVKDKLHYEWDGRKFHLCHGDRVNPKDFGYQVFRALTRNFISRTLVQMAPGPWIDRVGRTMSSASRGYHPEASPEVVRAFRNYACDRISSGYDFVLMGHSHHLEDMRFKVDQHEGQYVNVGYPRRHRKYLQLVAGRPFFSLESWEDLALSLRPPRQ